MKKTVVYNGKQVEAEVMEFTSPAEPWTEARVADGTLIRFKLVVREVVKMVGEFNKDGEPVYQTNWAIVAQHHVPKELCQSEVVVNAPQGGIN